MRKIMLKRPRRLRKTESIRSLCRETLLSPSQFIMPFFVLEGEKQREINQSLPGLSKFSKDELLKEAERLHTKGVPAILLFPARAPKDPQGNEALSPHGLIPKSIQL